MADKEPRKRKKRKDVSRKVHFSEDVHLEESSFASQKTETRDSDQETEDEAISIPSHQPSKIAKVVFVIFFSALVVTISSVFIALQGSERGSNDLFDNNSHELNSVLKKENDVHLDHTDESSDQQEFIISTIDYSSQLQEPSTLQSEPISSIDISEDELVNFTVHVSSINPEENSDMDSLDHFPEDLNKNFMDDAGTNEEELYDKSLETYDEVVISEEIKENDLTTTEFDEGEAENTDFQDDGLVLEKEFTKEPSVDRTTNVEDSSTIISNEHIHQEVNDEIEVDSVSVIQTENLEKESSEILQDDDAEDSHVIEYEKSDITNELDYDIREKLDDIDKIVEKSPEKALRRYEDILQQYPNSPRAYYGKSKALDKLAELQHSNKLLEEAILSYQNVMLLEKVPEKLYILAGNNAVQRMRFRGFVGKSLKLLIQMVSKFPNNTNIQNELAVGYLLIGQNKESKKSFMEVLKNNPDSGFAKVHLGFILKTDESKYLEAIKLMSEGIQSNEPGVIDGRFFFHLGDALQRVGKDKEAWNVYEEGVKKGLFLSAYQRSLYNFRGLTGKPWWNPDNTPYATYFKMLEKNWILIRNEALTLIDRKSGGFMPESENLQDNGEWKQFELFARGKKILNNCAQTPVTCGLVEQMPDAAGCKRGQVKFSIMQPGTHVWAHTGPTNCRLRAHLGLIVPEGVSIRVANETKGWKEGKVILFDDSFEHEVWHNGNSFRLVLITDFWHPELTNHQKATLSPI